MTYTYECSKCGVIQIDKGINEPEVTKCPNCGSEVKRIFKLSGIIWKCTGNVGKLGGV